MQSIEDVMLDAQLFRLWRVPSNLEDIVFVSRNGCGTKRNENYGKVTIIYTCCALHAN